MWRRGMSTKHRDSGVIVEHRGPPGLPSCVEGMHAMTRDDELFGPPPSTRRPAVRVLLLVSGAVLLFAGTVLGPVPVVPGFPLAVAGVVLLAGSSERMRRLVNAAERRLPERARRALRRLIPRRGERAESTERVDVDSSGR